MSQTSIEWTDTVWNPVVGCSKVSEGCDNCYAELTHRLRLDGRHGYPAFRPWTPENAEHNVTLLPHRLDDPERWRKPRMVFVNSMSDLFHPRVPREFIEAVFGRMAAAEQHTFQVLTKRPKRMAKLLNIESFPANALRASGRVGLDWPPPNIWLGTSIESREHVHRADALRDTPAAVRFISAEPLLGPLVEWMVCGFCGNESGEVRDCDECEGAGYWPLEGSLDLTEISWLIVGGESGPNHRPIEAGWARDLCDLAEMYETAFFFKQWGGRTPKAGGRELDGRTWDEMPEPAIERRAA